MATSSHGCLARQPPLYVIIASSSPPAVVISPLPGRGTWRVLRQRRGEQSTRGRGVWRGNDWCRCQGDVPWWSPMMNDCAQQRMSSTRHVSNRLSLSLSWNVMKLDHSLSHTSSSMQPRALFNASFLMLPWTTDTHPHAVKRSRDSYSLGLRHWHARNSREWRA